MHDRLTPNRGKSRRDVLAGAVGLSLAAALPATAGSPHTLGRSAL
jgi:hypothetical protein